MSTWQVPVIGAVHFTSPAKPGPSRDPQPKPAPPPPPKVRWWFLLAGLVVTVLLLSLPAMKTTTTVNFNFSTFLARVGANKVDTASINPNGGVTGKLKNGDDYTTQIPTVLDDPQLAPTLQAHHVSVTGVGASSSVVTDLLSFLPFLFFIGIFVWLSRSARRQLAGGIMGIGGNKAKTSPATKEPSAR
ncbi:MAG: ATP-dependent metallopeptidase FtsH/Yme1/Tma family protein [Acidimicrobiales bacterium]